jgi:hypothetical protein
MVLKMAWRQWVLELEAVFGTAVLRAASRGQRAAKSERGGS